MGIQLPILTILISISYMYINSRFNEDDKTKFSEYSRPYYLVLTIIGTSAMAVFISLFLLGLMNDHTMKWFFSFTLILVLVFRSLMEWYIFKESKKYVWSFTVLLGGLIYTLIFI